MQKDSKYTVKIKFITSPCIENMFFWKT